MEQERTQPIDLEVLKALNKKAYLPKTADYIAKSLNIDYNYTLKTFNKLEKKGLCDQWIVSEKRECDKKNNYFKVAYLNDPGKALCTYLSALERSKNKRKD
ncbi:hypothetical protein [Helicobacter pylori]|uniref:hypothetical protein n=1 Tax=Helicobacter pylori TaxID=210 RepID=UPI000FDD87BB|nr:hypothetical protein [Helicobacter pylori]RVZ53318.1 hypothetical protein EC557_03025 [Helicobacter pylori]RVZ91771.1 hypothetical protein EDC85_03305 [Helicobacter pylori]